MFYCLGLLILLDLTHCLGFSWWPLVLTLHWHAPADCSKVVFLPQSTAFPAMSRALPLRMPCTTIFQFQTMSFCCLLWTYFYLSFLIELNSLVSLRLCDAALCAFTVWTLTKTCLLPTSLVSLMDVSYFIISAVMFSSFRPFMNFSFSLLSYSWYLQSVALMISVHIHCRVHFRLFFSVYSVVRRIWFCCGMAGIFCIVW